LPSLADEDLYNKDKFVQNTQFVAQKEALPVEQLFRKLPELDKKVELSASAKREIERYRNKLSQGYREAPQKNGLNVIQFGGNFDPYI